MFMFNINTFNSYSFIFIFVFIFLTIRVITRTEHFNLDSVMEDDENPLRNPLVKKIDQIIRKTGFDETFIKAVGFHLRNIQKYEEIKSKEDLCNYLLSKFFIDKMDMYPTKRFKCQVAEYSNWPVQLLPVESFGEQKISDAYRFNSFYECLNISDVLDCRVATVKPTDYLLRVIHKYGTTGILDDLNLMVIMPKNGINMQVLKKELLPCELIRVKVTQIIKANDEVNVHVTVKEDNPEVMDFRQLGCISEELLPPYVLNPHDAEKFSSYSKYLNYMPQFRNPISLNEIYSGFGIDPFMMYSFYPEFDCSKCDEELSGQKLLKDSKVFDARKLAHSAYTEFQANNFSEAFNHINKAIQMCPPKDELTYSLYQIRGNLYSAAQKPKFSLKAYLDWTKALALNPKDKDVRKSISMYIFQAANKHYRKKEYRNAFITSERALEFDKDNVEANALTEYLKKKHPEIFFDEESLVALQEKQMELVTKLRRFETRKEAKK